ncbi:MAG: DMT family transporter [Dichotomicrobium sp.]
MTRPSPNDTLRPSLVRRAGMALFNMPYVLLTLTPLFWGGNFVIGRGVHEFFPPIALAAIRWTLAFLIILPFALPHLRRDWPAIRRQWPWLVFLGATGTGSFSTLTYIGLNDTPALNALIINSSGPVMIALASFIFFSDRLTPRQVLGILMSLIGVIVVVSRGDLETLAALEFNIGDLWVLAAMSIWGVYTAFLRKRPEIHWLSFAAALFFVAAAVNWPLFIWENAYVRSLTLSTDALLTIGYVAVFPSILSYVFYTRGVELIGGNRAGVFLHLIPMFGSALAILILGEQPLWSHGVGFALILTGVTIAARQARAKAPPPATVASRETQ